MIVVLMGILIILIFITFLYFKKNIEISFAPGNIPYGIGIYGSDIYGKELQEIPVQPSDSSSSSTYYFRKKTPVQKDKSTTNEGNLSGYNEETINITENAEKTILNNENITHAQKEYFIIISILVISIISVLFTIVYLSLSLEKIKIKKD